MLYHYKSLSDLIVFVEMIVFCNCKGGIFSSVESLSAVQTCGHKCVL